MAFCYYQKACTSTIEKPSKSVQKYSLLRRERWREVVQSSCLFFLLLEGLQQFPATNELFSANEDCLVKDANKCIRELDIYESSFSPNCCSSNKSSMKVSLGNLHLHLLCSCLIDDFPFNFCPVFVLSMFWLYWISIVLSMYLYCVLFVFIFVFLLCLCFFFVWLSSVFASIAKLYDGQVPFNRLIQHISINKVFACSTNTWIISSFVSGAIATVARVPSTYKQICKKRKN